MSSTLANLQRSFANALKPSQFGAWIDAVSNYLDALTDASGQVKVVSKQGSDTTGDGSFARPYLTIQAALTAITDASSSKPYTVMVEPGTYAETFTLKPWTFVEGVDQNDVTITQVNPNWVSTAFVSGTQTAGVSNVTFACNFVCDFSLVSAANAAKILLTQISIASGTIAIKGFSASNAYALQDIVAIGAVTAHITLTNISNGVIDGVYNAFGNVTFSSTDAYACVHRIGVLSSIGVVSLLWTGTVGTTGLFVVIEGVGSITYTNNFVISGLGAQLVSNSAFNQVSLANANATLAFGDVPNPAGSIIGISAGINQYEMNPSADRVISIARAANDGTRVIIKNSGDFFITITPIGGATLSGPTYIRPRGQWQAVSSGISWIVSPQIQAGVVTLVNGVSPIIPADLATSSRIVATLKTVSGAFGTPVPGSRATGVRGSGGQFVITSTLPATGAVVTTDQGTYDWIVV